MAQVGKWIVDLGEVDAGLLRGLPAEFAPEEIDRWSMTSKTPRGPLRHLKPVVHMSETSPAWSRPTVPLGYHHPSWPARFAL